MLFAFSKESTSMQKFAKLVSILLTATFAVAFTGGQTQATEALATISIPSIGVETSIVEAPLLPDYSTWDVAHLSMNTGHLTGTSWFGMGGNTVLGGHSETPSFAPDVFYHLDAVELNDIITVHANGTQYQYVVTEVKSVSLYDISVVYPTTGERLTLITCQRGTYDGSINDYENRIVVVAVPL